MIKTFLASLLAVSQLQGGVVPALDEEQRTLNSARLCLHENQKCENDYINYRGNRFVIMPGVISPKHFPETFFYADSLPIQPGQTFLEIGSGIGIVSVTAALKGAYRVAVVEINPVAASNTMRNALLHNVGFKFRVYEGDVFCPIPCGLKFDVIFWNPPFADHDLNCCLLTSLEKGIYDPKHQALSRYLREGKEYLTPNGSLFLGLSSVGNNMQVFEDLARACGWLWRVVASHDLALPRCPEVEESI